MYLVEVIEALSEEDCKSLMLVCKWCCDGSQSQYKQKFENSDLKSNKLFCATAINLWTK